MAELDYEVGIAAAVQTDYATVNATLKALNAGDVGATDGSIYGAPDVGVYKSGVTIPEHNRVAEMRAPIQASYSTTLDQFTQNKWEGMQIAFPLGGTGNAVSATPGAGEAQPDAGIDALLQACGLVGANGTAPVYTYTPLGSTKYVTIKLWTGTHSFVYAGCVVESLSIPFVAGQWGNATANIRIGWLDEFVETHGVDTWSYGNNNSAKRPRAVGSVFTYGSVVAGFNEVTLEIANTIEEAGDSNNADQGVRIYQSAQLFSLSGNMYVDSADADIFHQAVGGDEAPTDDFTWRIGLAATGADPLDIAIGLNFALNNAQINSWKPDQLAEVMTANFAAHATTTTANTEFSLTYD